MRVVVDTNVLFEGLTHLGPPAQVIDAWVQGRFQPCVSTALALEYQDVIARLLRPQRGEAALKALQALLSRASYTPIWYSFRPASRDPGDDLIIDCVLNSQAILVTLNLRDFRQPAEEFGFSALSPIDFLRFLEEETQP
jgi:putative PIN family toxin of toxin-antitoxin system